MGIPSNSPYSSLMMGYFGNLDTTAQNALWQSFKDKNGFTTDPANTDINALVEFSGFIQAAYTDNQTLILSPEEVQKRQLLFNLYDIIITMMKSIQNTIGVTGQNIAFLGKDQGVYTDEMARAAQAFYIGGASGNATVNTADLTKWKLGYGDLTMAEYLKTAILAQTPAATPLEIHSDFVNSNQNTLAFSATDSSITILFTAQQGAQVDFPISNTVAFDPSLSIEDKMAIAVQGFLALYGTTVPGTGKTVSQFINDPLQPVHIPYGVVTDRSVPINLNFKANASDVDHAKMAAAAGARSTKNSLLQQFLENTRSRREIIGNQSDAQKSNLDQSKQGISTSDNILQATIKQLSTIVDAIFKIG